MVVCGGYAGVKTGRSLSVKGGYIPNISKVLGNIGIYWEMRLIVLSGLVTVEKNALALEIAQTFQAAGIKTLLVDSVQRLPLNATAHGPDAYVRLAVLDAAALAAVLHNTQAGTVLLLAAETLAPDALFVLLDDVQQAIPTLEIITLALIDTRTCDCFPHFRIALEDYADFVVSLPFDTASVIGLLAGDRSQS